MLTLVLIAAGAAGLALLLLAFWVLRDPAAAQRRVQAAFRRPPRAPKTAGREHYYRPYWSR
jgi:hypothetical protein